MSEQPQAFIPDWIVSLVGRLVIENEALRRTPKEPQADGTEEPLA